MSLMNRDCADALKGAQYYFCSQGYGAFINILRVKGREQCISQPYYNLIHKKGQSQRFHTNGIVLLPRCLVLYLYLGLGIMHPSIRVQGRAEYHWCIIILNSEHLLTLMTLLYKTRPFHKWRVMFLECMLSMQGSKLSLVLFYRQFAVIIAGLISLQGNHHFFRLLVSLPIM